MAEQLTDVKPLATLKGKTVIVTGGANGIGLKVVLKFYAQGANVVIADLPSAELAADAAIGSLEDKSRIIFAPLNIISWEDMSRLYQATLERFGRVNIVVANAGIMENRHFFDFVVDEAGELREDSGSGRVIDVNLKGAMNTLRLAVFHMHKNEPNESGWRGSVVLVSSTSGYIGGTEVVSYISSKHGVIGLLRSSHAGAGRRGIRVNGVAPFITPTTMTGGYTDAWKARGLPTNTPAGVASAILRTALDTSSQGQCQLVIGDAHREIEAPIKSTLANWAGEDVAELFRRAGAFFQSVGGYPLPTPRG